MSYHIYTTEGIILKRTVYGEANILLHVFTQDLGLIMASARSARLSVSKLRPALQEYSLVSISCIKGKNGWKVTNVAGIGSLYYDYPDYTHTVLAQVSKVLLQMIVGESVHPEIFKSVKSGFEYLKNISKEDLPSFETLLVLKILHELGYVAKTPELEKYLSSSLVWSPELLQNVYRHKLEFVTLINKALRESQL